MISLAECAPCKAMRLQAEAEDEFRQRFGVVNAPPAMKGWRPYMGQATAVFPATGAAPVQSSPYLDQTKRRLMGFASRGIFAFPVGIVLNTAFTGLRRRRKEAAMLAGGSAVIGLIAAFLPWESPFLDTLSAIGGGLTGLGLSKVALPKREEAVTVTPL